MMAARLLPKVRSNSQAGARLAAGIVLVGALFNAAVGILSLIAPATFLMAVGQSTPVVAASTLVFGEYAADRELAIAVALIICAAVRLTPVLAGVLVVAATANALDALGALASGRWLQLPRALLFAVAFAGAAVWYARETSTATTEQTQPTPG